MDVETGELLFYLVARLAAMGKQQWKQFSFYAWTSSFSDSEEVDIYTLQKRRPANFSQTALFVQATSILCRQNPALISLLTI